MWILPYIGILHPIVDSKGDIFGSRDNREFILAFISTNYEVRNLLKPSNKLYIYSKVVFLPPKKFWHIFTRDEPIYRIGSEIGKIGGI